MNITGNTKRGSNGLGGLKWLQLLGWLGLLVGIGGCSPCTGDEVDDEVGGEFFTVEYRTPTGANYLTSVYNTDNVIVYVDTTGGASDRPPLKLIRPGFSDGKFGPFYFTEKFVDLASFKINDPRLLGQRFRYDYYIQKDTYGTDVIRVDFLYNPDECARKWEILDFYFNGELQANFSKQRKVDIVITE